MKKLLIGLLVLGFATQNYAQVRTEKLPELDLTNVNSDYIQKVDMTNETGPVKMLEEYAASYDLVKSDFVEDKFINYAVFFENSHGTISATYDKEGRIIKTFEKFKDVQPPRAVVNAIFDTYPGWKIANDIYLVKYNENSGVTKKYKLVLEKDNEFIKVKTDGIGNYL